MSLTQDEMMAVGIVIALNEKKRKRSKWTKDLLLKRDQTSHTNLMKELKLDPDEWRNYMRMDESSLAFGSRLTCWILNEMMIHNTKLSETSD